MKGYDCVFSPFSLTDLENAIQYYSQIQNGLGKKFYGQFSIGMKAILQNPLHARIYYDDVRCKKIPKFPYLIHYTVSESEKTIIIAAVWPTRRRPLWE